MEIINNEENLSMASGGRKKKPKLQAIEGADGKFYETFGQPYDTKEDVEKHIEEMKIKFKKRRNYDGHHHHNRHHFSHGKHHR